MNMSTEKQCERCGHYTEKACSLPKCPNKILDIDGDLFKDIDAQVAKGSYDGWYDEGISRECCFIAKEFAKKTCEKMLQWIEDNDIKNLTPQQTAKFYFETLEELPT